uniref:Acetylglutamate kinase n=1 Tax=Melanthalia intermedia TaxID=172989 RepID=A0A345UAY6_9FLOR|nr:acetylglutamate kinase [Melanthalia intermedia]AXI97622.1 acetylglutamate kinase [Melanthalia intermedia]
MSSNFDRVQILSDALPFIQRFYGRTIVVKYGGSAMRNSQLKDKIIQDILLLSYIGIKIVLVHGGGPVINHWLKKVDIMPKFVDGVRVTNKATMEIVEMVLVGKINKDLVTSFNHSYPLAIGLSGKDANLIMASPLFVDQPFNYTGKITRINVNIINLLISQGYIPVVASVAADSSGQAYNINADTVAGAIAASLNAEKLVLLTDVSGIMLDINIPSSLVRHLNIQQAYELKLDEVIAGGMIPKIDCCIKALQNNVKAVHILNASVEHALLLEILTSDGIGSMLTL